MDVRHLPNRSLLKAIQETVVKITTAKSEGINYEGVFNILKNRLPKLTREIFDATVAWGIKHKHLYK